MDTTMGPAPTAANDAVGCPASAHGAPIMSASPAAGEASLGRHLARRLVQVGVGDVFAVPGDFNLTLLDHLIAEPGLRLVGCCNELNAGYAADGYARARGVGACAVTFTVGGLSVLNAIAGAYSENLPVICIAGGPNSNDYGTNRILHHTIGVPDFSQELRCFQTITCYQAVVTNLDDAHEQIDTAIATALRESKPVYISISCNLPGLLHPTFTPDPVPLFLAPKMSNKMGLEAAVEATVHFLNKAVKPVLVAGPKLRVAKAAKAFGDLVDSSGYAYAIMPSAKGLVPETHPHFIGTYWGAERRFPARPIALTLRAPVLRLRLGLAVRFISRGPPPRSPTPPWRVLPADRRRQPPRSQVGRLACSPARASRLPAFARVLSGDRGRPPHGRCRALLLQRPPQQGQSAAAPSGASSPPISSSGRKPYHPRSHHQRAVESRG